MLNNNPEKRAEILKRFKSSHRTLEAIQKFQVTEDSKIDTLRSELLVTLKEEIGQMFLGLDLIEESGLMTEGFSAHLGDENKIHFSYEVKRDGYEANGRIALDGPVEFQLIYSEETIEKAVGDLCHCALYRVGFTKTMEGILDNEYPGIAIVITTPLGTFGNTLARN